VRLLVTIALLLPAIVSGQPPTEDGVRLRVKPILCVTDNRNPTCDLTFLVTWQSGTTGYYCIFNDFDESPLRCWVEERSGQMTDDRSFDESFTFWLTGEDLRDRLAEVEIEVLRLDSDDRRRNRRTRHIWDIN
jgi:hypothetical protein